ncbi:MAG: hypothetical protein IEMM0008_0974 [bacterium]|nr:MAG: hypothetical protein IEMM0008_0974 [bacterium]
MRLMGKFLAVFSLMLLAVSGYSGNVFFLDNISSYGQRIDNLILLVTLIVMPAFIICVSLVVYFVLRYKRRDGAEKALYETGGSGSKLAKKILIIDGIVFALDILILFVAIPTWMDVAVDKISTQDAVEVRVNARQFDFDFHYAPGPDGKWFTKDDVKITGELRVPVDKKIVLHMTSFDVIHDFWAKNLRMKQDILPGRTITRWFQVNKSLVEKIKGFKAADWNTKVDVKSVISNGNVMTSILADDIHNAKTEKDKKEAREELKEAKDDLKKVYKKNLLGKRLFEIACAEICGNGHYKMNAWLVVEKQDAFDQWLKKKVVLNSKKYEVIAHHSN